MEGEAPSMKEGRRPRRGKALSGVVGAFPGTSRTTLKVPGEDDVKEDVNLVEEEEYERNFKTTRLQDSLYECPRLLLWDSTLQRSFIKSFQLTFHNDKENFSEERKKDLYATSFFIGRAAKWIEPYNSNITNKDQA
ncbi:hypothetical protein O181_084415 [Austropuccinia psidii MF-1]|uniref:DUF4939 domain-containing protein n=1 Tax=Austropuccinia psidii MF-1 TaxID=1389203 RepID=A0A9Q3FVK7_9BASI|nr:hypothetical protein [Austropuccinia psidii MF-1]